MPTKPKMTSEETEPIPEGWTDDPESLLSEQEYGFANAYLTSHSVLLTETPESGEFGFICSSNGRYYFGDSLAYSMCEITKPTTYAGILHALNTKGYKGLRVRLLEPILPPGMGDFVLVSRSQEKGGCCKTCAKLDAANSQCKP
ncbi:hypothetical protein AbraIFM66950_008734 [Aspergillus brasiliensis]|nr:hypothetical protein AbraIFM66950_008734 [Aspergillus brasiliensis]